MALYDAHGHEMLATDVVLCEIDDQEFEWEIEAIDDEDGVTLTRENFSLVVAPEIADRLRMVMWGERPEPE